MTGVRPNIRRVHHTGLCVTRRNAQCVRALSFPCSCTQFIDLRREGNDLFGPFAHRDLAGQTVRESIQTSERNSHLPVAVFMPE